MASDPSAEFLPADIIFNEATLLLQHLVEVTGINVTRTSIRKAILKSDNYPFVTLEYVSHLLKHWGIDSLAVEPDLDIFRSASYPSIILLQTQSDAGQLVLLTGATTKNMYYYLPGSGMKKENIETFISRSKNAIVLLLEISDTAGEPDYLELKNKQERAMAKERKKIRSIPNFLTEDECLGIIDNYNSALSRQTMDRTSPISLNTLGTSKYEALRRAMADKLNIGNDRFVEMKMYRFAPGERLFIELATSQDQESSVLVHLNDNFEGGETYFPEIEHKVIPKAGQALLIPTHVNGKLISSFLVEELPVHSGVKYLIRCYLFKTSGRSVKKNAENFRGIIKRHLKSAEKSLMLF